MVFVVCMVAASPMRREATHRSEMVSQLLFGEQAEVLGQSGDFTRVRCCYDQYEGWCQTNQLQQTDRLPEKSGLLLSAEWASKLTINDATMWVSMGTPLSLFDKGTLQLGSYHAVYTGQTWDAATASFTEALIKQVAFTFLNTPYLWGGRSVFGIDCSGYVQQVYRFFNKPLPRDAYQQAEPGEVIGFLQEAVCGDLAFFDNEEGRITHVGLMLDASTIIHSSGKVRIDPIDQAGIVNAETGERTHRLRIIKRY
ncbi:C40 family peptidase [Asinibacterium sp. OR53]|uniref:C40 family peptidase n=1 Tax=Asinibacterium sp. OR53 TaxID=925409 RepID=UPI00047C43C9|nr:C40 family peptidase [Asinibacterium sp. OR53]